MHHPRFFKNFIFQTSNPLVIHGTMDEDVPFEDARLLEHTLPNVHLVAIEGGDHAAFYTHAELVMPMLNTFLVS